MDTFKSLVFCNYLCVRVSRAAVFEEEDFQPSVYGYNLATMFSDSKASSMLRDCEEELQKTEKKLKGQKVGTPNGDTGDGALCPDDLEILNGLLSRLKFLRNFYSLLLHIWKRDNLNECPKLISICQESLAIMQKTSNLGVQRDTDDTCKLLNYVLTSSYQFNSYNFLNE